MQGRHFMDNQRYQGLLDLINGGGAGQAGQTFEGGALSGLLNSLGIRPMGYRDRLAEARPAPNPMMMEPTVSTMGAPPATGNYAYVAGRPDVPQAGMPNAAVPDQIAELLRLLGIGQQPYAMSTPPMGSMGGNYDPMYRGAMVPPSAQGYGPR
jgi:hypothetical protein